jgi:hypothetical protein
MTWCRQATAHRPRRIGSPGSRLTVRMRHAGALRRPQLSLLWTGRGGAGACGHKPPTTRSNPSSIPEAAGRSTVARAALALAGSQLKPVSVPASAVLAAAGAFAMATVCLLTGRQSVQRVPRWTGARSGSELTWSGAYGETARFGASSMSRVITSDRVSSWPAYAAASVIICQAEPRDLPIDHLCRICSQIGSRVSVCHGQ